MAEAQLRQFLDKVRQLNAFVALSEADPALRQELRDCDHHDQVVALARRCGFEIGRRWGEPPAAGPPAQPVAGTDLPAGPGPTGSPAASGGLRQFGAGAAPPENGLRTTAAPGPVSMASREARAGWEVGSAASMAQLPGSPDGSAGQQRHQGHESALEPAFDPTAVATGLLSCAEPPCSLLASLCPPPGQERTDVLVETPQWRLERIHSCDCTSPAGFWYEQQEEEWVMLLQGSAGLRFADQPGDLVLSPGDSVWIRADRRHRVTATDPAPGTIWLALFWRTA